MKEIVEDWMFFCETKVEYLRGYFHTLLMDNPTDEEIKSVYQYFPNQNDLIRNLKKWIIDRENQTFSSDRLELESVLKQDINDRYDILSQLPEVTFDLVALKPTFERFETMEAMMMDDLVSQSFLDYIRINFIRKAENRYGDIERRILSQLLEALYGITSNFDIQFFLYQPLLKTNYTGKSLYEFTVKGGVYAFTESGISYSAKGV